jgi:hypothetical protein
MLEGLSLFAGTIIMLAVAAGILAGLWGLSAYAGTIAGIEDDRKKEE